MTADSFAANPRDPRKNPKRGDILRLGSEKRTVGDVSLHQIQFQITSSTAPMSFGYESRTPQRWKDWAKTAEVLHYAE